MIIVLGTSVLSKLTLVSLTDKLRNVTYYPNSTKRAAADNEVDFDTAVTLYWYLQFVLLVPNLITFVRCLAFGVIGKTTITYPWPKGCNILLVSFTKLSSNILVWVYTVYAISIAIHKPYACSCTYKLARMQVHVRGASIQLLIIVQAY